MDFALVVPWLLTLVSILVNIYQHRHRVKLEKPKLRLLAAWNLDEEVAWFVMNVGGSTAYRYSLKVVLDGQTYKFFADSIEPGKMVYLRQVSGGQLVSPVLVKADQLHESLCREEFYLGSGQRVSLRFRFPGVLFSPLRSNHLPLISGKYPQWVDTAVFD